MKVTNKKINDCNCCTREFSSLQEVTSYISSTKILNMFSTRPRGAGSTITNNERTAWSGTSNFEEALNLLRTGWTDKSKEIEQKFSNKIKKEPSTVIRQKSVYDVVGGNASVPRYLQGVPTNMIRQVRKPVKEKVVTINYNISYNFDVSAETISQKAINCLSYIKHLEDTGIRVNLNVFWMTHYASDYVTFIIPVKKSNERLSIAKLSFCLCNPSMLRRVCFALLERESSLINMVHGFNFSDAYGRSVSTDSKIPAEKEILEAILVDRNMTVYKD